MATEPSAALQAASEEARTPVSSGQVPVPVRTEPQPGVEEWRQAFFRTILAGQEDRAHALVNDLLAHRIDLPTIYLDVFEWAMHRVGDSYVQGVTDAAHEHLASEITQRMMGRVAHLYTPMARRPYRALLGGVAGNLHALGLRMLSDGLRTQGWETLFLGANVPTADFLAMAKTERPDLVVVTCMLDENQGELKLLLDLLHTARREQEELHYRLTAGGQFLDQNPRVLHELPIDFRARTLREFLETVSQFFP